MVGVFWRLGWGCLPNDIQGFGIWVWVWVWAFRIGSLHFFFSLHSTRGKEQTRRTRARRQGFCVGKGTQIAVAIAMAMYL